MNFLVELFLTAILLLLFIYDKPRLLTNITHSTLGKIIIVLIVIVIARGRGLGGGLLAAGIAVLLLWRHKESFSGQCSIGKGLAFLANGPAPTCIAATTPLSETCKNMDGRYDYGNPERYTGGWALVNGLGNPTQCTDVCYSQPECQKKGNTCKATPYPSSKRCYCAFCVPKKGDDYVDKIREAALANPKCIAFGQQSNGCWHLLQWNPAATGSDKKTKSMYPKYFEVVRPPTAAQCGNCIQDRDCGACRCDSKCGKVAGQSVCVMDYIGAARTSTTNRVDQENMMNRYPQEATIAASKQTNGHASSH